MRSPRETTAAAATTSTAVSRRALVLAAAALGAAWIFDLTVLRTPVLTHFVAGGRQIPPATPLYAFWMPIARPQSIAFIGAAILLVALAARLVDTARTSRAVFTLVLGTTAIVLPLALFVVRQPLSELGALLLTYKNEEVLADAARIRVYAPFLRNYVEHMPQLSLHGKHFPPGHATWLYALIHTFGPGTLQVAIAVLSAFAAGVVLWFAAFRQFAEERGARAGALLLLACPSLLDFALTSMDAVLFGASGLATCLAARAAARLAPSDGDRRGHTALFAFAVATGAALFIATMLSFSALPLGLMIGLFLLVTGRHAFGRATLAVLAIGASFAACGLLLWTASGFSILACLARAIELNKEFMSHVVKRDAHELYGYLSYGNAAGFAIGAGVALVAATGSRLARGRSAWTSFTTASAITLAVMIFGGIYFMETERIWMYAMPWLAGIVATRGAPDDGSLRVLLAVGTAQALALEALLFTLW
ncbi:MAG: hypothetical protein ACKVWV_10995 [Planctomycetota bacterium]